MFTGLVQGIGTVVRVDAVGAERRIAVDLSGLPPDRAAALRVGDSVALSGACCTVVALAGAVADFHLSRETLERTWLGGAAAGTRLNLEAALRAGDALGGHFVQGHVDGVAVVTGAVDAQQGGTLRVRLPSDLWRYCVEKGSLALDGVSLTIAALAQFELAIAVIPHTAQQTTLGERKAGELVHVEVDVLAKYVESLLHRE